jgi:hypothetical protein
MLTYRIAKLWRRSQAWTARSRRSPTMSARPSFSPQNQTGYLSLPKSNGGALASCSFVRSVVNFASLPTLS